MEKVGQVSDDKIEQVILDYAGNDIETFKKVMKIDKGVVINACAESAIEMVKENKETDKDMEMLWQLTLRKFCDKKNVTILLMLAEIFIVCRKLFDDEEYQKFCDLVHSLAEDEIEGNIFNGKD